MSEAPPAAVPVAEASPAPLAAAPLATEALALTAPPPPESPPTPNRLLSLAKGERPQERALARGVGSLADTELLALLIRSGTRGHDVMSLASELLSRAGSLHDLTRWRDTDFRRLKGIGRIKALQLCAVMEVTRRVLGAERQPAPELHQPEQIYAFLRPRALGLDVEKCWVLALNTRNRLLRCAEVTSGTARQTLVRPVEVIREAVREGATAFVLAHNHPSGDPAPSAADMRVTRQVRDAATTVDLHFHDHIVVGDPVSDPIGQGYYSFRQGGHI